MVAQQEQMSVDVLTVMGWYHGNITLPVGGRLLDYLNTKHEMIALTGVVDPGGTARGFVAINTAQVLAIRPRPRA
jgi:hypothetical protein